MSKQASNRKPLIVGIIAAVVILAVLLVLLLTQCTPGGGSGASNSDTTASGKPVVENADLYWNVDRALYDGMSEGGMSSRRAESDGYFHVRFFKDGKMVELKVESRSVVNKLEVRDLMGLVFDDDGIVVDVIPIEDMPVQKVGWKFYVQSTGGKIIKVNSSNKFDGLEVLLETGSNTKVYDMTGTMGEVGSETTAVLNDRVMAVADLEGNLLAVYIYDRSNMVVEFQAHCQHCDMEVTWQEWDNTKQLPKEGGHFKLVTDVQLNAQQSIKADAKICLDLNGHTVDGKEGARVYSVHNLNSELAIMDTSEEQTGKLATHGEIYAQGAVIWARNGDVYLYAGTLDASDSQCTGRGGAAVYVPKGRFFYMYGGEIVGGTAKYYFNEDNGQYVNGVGGSLYVIGKFVMKDGVIRDGVAQSIAVWTNGKASYKRGLGGNIFVGSGGEFVMDGGSIQNGRAGSSGNVYLDGTAEFTMNAGTISGGYVMDAGREGGNVNVGPKATFTMNGGVISYGTGNNNSGNVYCSGTFVMQGGMITGGRVLNAKTGAVKETAVSSNMYLSSGSKLYMYGGTIHGRVAAVDGTAGDGKRTSIVLAGLPVIYNGTEGVTNLTLQPGKEPVQVTVLALHDLAKIGINASGKFTLETKEENRDNFISDIQDAEVLYVDKCLAVGRMACLCGSKTDKHVGDCDGEQLLWGPWTTTNGLPATSGSYFLANDVAFTSPKNLGTSDALDTVINLDLNGKTIQSAQRAFVVYGELNLADHVGGGKIVGAGMKDGKNHTGAVLVFTDSKLNIYGGTIALADQHYNLTTGGALGVGAGAVVNLYEGVIDGRSLDADGKDSDTTGTIGDGGAVRLHGTMNVYGGAVYGGVANRGGAFFVEKNGQLSILGGTVYGGTAAQGGAVCVTGSKAKLTVSGGTVKDGTAAEGGNIRQLGSSNVEISGGTISGGVSTGKGGNISNASGILTVSGGKIVDGSSKGNGGNIAVGGKLILSGGFVSGGKVKDDAANHTANILVQNCALELSGGEVAGGLLVLNSSEENKTSVTLSGAPVVTRPNTYGLRLMGVGAGEPDMIIDGKLDDKASIAIDATDVFTTKTVAENADNFVPADKLDTIHYGQDECLFVGRVHCLCETGKESWCDHKDVRWSKWDGKTSLTEGNYYLTSDVTIKKNLGLGQEGKNLNICLNGHTITGSNVRIMNVYGNVSIFDHGEGKGALIGTGAPVKKTVEDGKTILTPEHSAVAVVFAKATLNVYGGSLKLADNHNELSAMGGVAAIAADGVMNIYGGSVDASASLTSEAPVGAGGAIRVDGLLNVYGGQIIGGKVTGNGGAVLLRSKTAEMNVFGGTITGGQAQYGGAIYVNDGKLTISKGTVSGGTAGKDGGSIYAKGGALTLSGGALEKGTASGKGGNIFLAGGSLTVSGGAVTGGTASQGGNIAVQQAEKCTVSGVVISGGTISGGKAGNANNENLYVNNQVLKLSGGKIEGGVSIINTSGALAGVELSGAPVITNDKGNTNLRLVKTGGEQPLVKIVGKLTGEPKTIGITAPLGMFATNAAAADAAVFFDDAERVGVAHKETMLYLGQLRCFCGAAQNGDTYDSATHTAWCDETMGVAIWLPWDGTSNLAEGNYYLTSSVTNTKLLALGEEGKTLNISLDGFTITGKNTRVMNVYGNVNILDHVGQTGALVGTGGPVTEKEEDGKVTRTVEHSAVALVNANGVLNLYGGSLKMAENHNELSDFGGVAAVVKGGTMNIYGGSVDASASLTSEIPVGSGGAIRVDGLLNIYGGQIVGGKVTKNGGAILLRSATAEVNVSGGTITGGQAVNGGAIYVADGKLVISGGTVSGGTANKDGGAIYIKAGSLTVSGGTVENGKAGTTSKGGNIMVVGGSLTVSGGNVTGGTASQGSNIAVHQASGHTVTGVAISGGNVTGGTATANANSANLYVNNQILKLSGGKIEGGVSIINTSGTLAGVELSGAPVITNDKGNSNLRLAQAGGELPTVKIVGELNGEPKSIGITAPAGAFAIEAVADNAAIFFDDGNEMDVVYKDTQLYLGQLRCLCGAAKGGSTAYDSVTHSAWCDKTMGMAVWLPWDGTYSLAEGNYYLTGSVTNNKNIGLGEEGKALNISLDGYTITSKNCRTVNVNGNVSIFDHMGQAGALVGAGGPVTEKEENGQTVRTVEHSAVALVTKNATLNLYGGNLKLAQDHNELSDLGGVVAVVAGGTMNVYGGSVDASASLTSETPVGSGGAIRVDGLLNVCGGQIIGGKVTKNGGAILLRSATAEVDISGGTITGGQAVNGGAIYVTDGKLTVSGGTVNAGSVTLGSTTSGNGAAICMEDGIVDLNGGTLGAATTDAVGSRGGIVYVESGTLTIDGATINGAKVGQGGSIYQAAGSVIMKSGSINGGVGNGTSHGGSIYVAAGATFQLQGGTVQNGQSEKKNGGNFAVNGTLVISGDAQVKGGTATNNSGNIYVQNGVLKVSGNASIDGKVSVISTNATGSTVELSGPVTIAGANGEFLNLGKTGSASVPVVQVTGALSDGEKKANVIVRLGNTTKGVFAEASGTYVLSDTDKTCFTAAQADLIATYDVVGENMVLALYRCLCKTGDKTWCDHTKEAWLPWNGTATLGDGQNYYLSKAVELEKAVTVGSAKTIKLDLDGKSITSDARAFNVREGAVMSIVDSSYTSGSITAMAIANDSGGVFHVLNGTLNLYSGTFKLAAEHNNVKNGGVMVIGGTSQVNIHGGTLGGSITSGTVAEGGAIRVGAGELNIYDGTINGHPNAETGGAICVAGGNVTVIGGTVAGEIYAKDKSFTVSGGTITKITLVNKDTVTAGLQLSGAPVISTVKLVGDSGKTAPTITIAGALTGNAGNIGVDSAAGLFATGAVEADAEKFKDANLTYVPVHMNGELHLARQSCLCGAAQGPAAVYENATHTKWCADSGKKLLIWQPWDGTASLTESGNYFLTADGVTGAGAQTLRGLTINLDLMGKTYEANTRVFLLQQGADVAIMNGTVTGGGTLDKNGGLFTVDASKLTLYSGTYKLAAEHNNVAEGGVIAMGKDASVVTIHEAVVGGTTTSGSVTLGGAIRMDGGTLNILGGTVNGHSNTTTHGGTIYVKKGTVNMSGGNLYAGGVPVGNADLGNGAGIYMEDGEVNLNGGTLAAATTNAVGSRGGIVYVAGGQLNIDGATINGAKVSQAGSIYQEAGTVIMSSGSVNGGTGTTSANRHGGSIYIALGATFKLQGGKVQGGTIENKSGGNFAVNGTLEISGDAQVLDGSAPANANSKLSANIYVQNAVLKLSGNATINGGVSVINSSATGSTLQVSGAVSITNGYLNLGKADPQSHPVIQITGALVDGEKKASIPVKLGNGVNTGVFAEASGTYALTEADVSCFTPADTTLRIRQVGNQLELYVPHLHCWCENADAVPADHTCVDDQEWTAIEKSGNKFEVEEDGYYYLNWTGENAAKAIIVKSGKTAYLCLNGSAIRASECIQLEDGATLHICDCSDGQAGVITTTKQSPINVAAGQSVYLYSGKVNGTNGTVASRIGVNMAGGSFYMYGGKLVNGCSAASQITDSTKKEAASMGGNLYMTDGAFYMYGGEISGGKLGDASRDVTVLGGTFTIGGKVSIGTVNLAEGKTITIASPLTGGIIGIDAAEGLFATGAVAADAAKFSDVSGNNYACYVNGELHLARQSCLCGVASGATAVYGEAEDHTEWCAESGLGVLLWKYWDGTTAISSGNYYLGKNNAELTVELCGVEAGKTLNLSLNGNTVKHTGKTRAFNVNKNSTLNITDWSTTAGTVSGMGPQSLNHSAVALVFSGAKLNLFRGTLALAENHNALNNLGGVAAIAAGGEMNIYDGCVDASAESTNAVVSGGAIRVDGTLNLYGGTIIGAEVTEKGGALLARKDASAPQINIYGGTIQAGEAVNGDAICLEKGTLTVGGKTVVGEIYLAAGRTITVKDDLDTTVTAGETTTNYPIPVTMETAGVFAVAETGKTLTYEDKAHFKSANTDYQVAFTVNGMELVSATVPATCACKTTNGTHEAWCNKLDPVAWVDDKGNAITGTLPSSGTYYLTDDVSLTEVCNVSGNLNLWLNGFSVTIADTYTVDAELKNEYVFHAGTDNALALLDTKSGTVYARSSTVEVIRGSGTIVIDGANVDASAIAGSDDNGLAVYAGDASGNAGLFLLKSGTVTGGATIGWGGAVYVAGGSTMRMSGGTVTGGTAYNGGNIGSRGLVYITGGNITNGAYTSGKGGNVYAEGNVEISGISTVISGGKRSGGTVNNDRINVVCWGSSLKLTDVSISGGVWVASNDNDTCTLSGNVTIGDGTNGLTLGVAASKKADAEPMPPATIVIDGTLGSTSKVSVLIHSWSRAAGKIIATGLTQEQTTGGIFTCVTSGWALESKEQSDGTYQLVLKAN